MAAVAQARDRLLARVAALVERDRALVEPGLGGQHAVVDLVPPPRRTSLDPLALELLVVHRRLHVRVEDLDRRRAVVAVRDSGLAAEDDRRDVLLPLDLALRREPHPRQASPDRLAEPGLRQEQEVVRAPPPDDERRDHARSEERRVGKEGRSRWSPYH